MAKRLEITVSEDVLARLDEARGHEPRASFVKRALETALGAQTKAPELSEPTGANLSPASSRAPVEKEPAMSSQSPLVPKAVPASSRRVSPDVVRRQAALNKAKGMP